MNRETLYFNLSTALAAGMPMSQALELCRGAQAQRMCDAVRAGGSVASTIEDAFERGVVEAFEATGRLDAAFGELARLLESRRLARSRFWSKMLYPVFVLHAVILIPPVLVAFHEGAWAYARAVAVPLAGVYGAFALFLWRPSLVAFVPVFGAAYRAQERARSLRALAMLWEAGIPVDRAMELAGLPAGSGTLTDRLAATRRFDATVLAATEVGETSGRVGESLKRAAVAIDLDATTRLDRAMKLLPVAAIVLLGVATAMVLIAGFGGR